MHMFLNAEMNILKDAGFQPHSGAPNCKPNTERSKSANVGITSPNPGSSLPGFKPNSLTH